MIISRKHLENLFFEFSDEELQIILMEECAELQKEISKLLRNKGDLNNLTEEMAHVLISIDSVMHLYSISDDDIYSEILKKGGSAYEGQNPDSARKTIFGKGKRTEPNPGSTVKRNDR